MIEQLAEKLAEKATEKLTEKLAEKQAEKLAYKQAEKLTGREDSREAGGKMAEHRLFFYFCIATSIDHPVLSRTINNMSLINTHLLSAFFFFHFSSVEFQSACVFSGLRKTHWSESVFYHFDPNGTW